MERLVSVHAKRCYKILRLKNATLNNASLKKLNLYEAKQ
jgi:hypothetical protein